MKTTNQFLTAIVLALLLISPTTILAQDDAPKGPEYISVTKMYWNKNYEGTPEEWRANEKEYMDKVTKKNEYVIGAGYYTHLFTENSNEVLYVQSYPNWEALDKASARNSELEKEAWPDEEARKAFLKKLNGAYSIFHSDEIYATMDGAKHMEKAPEKDMVLYLRQSKMTYTQDGTFKEFQALRKKLLDGVIYKNEFIKAYYPSIHAWGADRRDMNEAIILESLGDLHKLFDRNVELMKEVFTEEESKAFGKYFKSHGDYLYTIIKL
ncbi:MULTISPECIES: hypothetical protein [Hwangdonia]|uniref:Uncharacterized protein n=1 Tax=Hwangdonia seohaensis TaxID=1240727 RepID=A0ABW3R7K4_9FLAO|nr:hypothetical protein [Hwangdonia seohaensis]